MIPRTRRGAFIPTYSGVHFYVFDPRPSEVHVADIAHGHSLDVRWGGQSRWAVPTGQHAVIASYLGGPGEALPLLLHDGAEAYLRDLPRPIKRDPAMARYREVEEGISDAIAVRFRLPPRFWTLPVIERVDEQLAATEWRDASGHDRDLLLAVREGMRGVSDRPMADVPEPLDNITIVPWTALQAEVRFLLRFAELTGEDVTEDVLAAFASSAKAASIRDRAAAAEYRAVQHLLDEARGFGDRGAMVGLAIVSDMVAEDAIASAVRVPGLRAEADAAWGAVLRARGLP